jgi:hypothetical protein
MNPHETPKKLEVPAKTKAPAIEGELSLEDLKAKELSMDDMGAVIGGDGAKPIVFFRTNPQNQKTRFAQL